MAAAYNHKPTIELIKSLEGFTGVAKYDVNRYRIGYGCEFDENGNYVKAGMVIDKARGEKILIYNLKLKQKALDTYLLSSTKSKINEYQNGALVSYVFNRGEGKFKDSKLRTMVNKNPNDSLIPKQFEKEWGTNEAYKKALITRRAKEGAFYKKIDLSNPTAVVVPFLTLLAAVFLFYRYATN